jgi:flagellar motor switch protein FliM
MNQKAETNAANISDKLLDASGISAERLPMLHVIFDRMATYIADGMRHMSSSSAYCSVSIIESGRIGDVLEGYNSNAVAGMYHAPEWDSRILIGFDHDFVFSMVEILFGSDGAEPPYFEERPLSNVELRICQMVFDEAAKALRHAFAPISETRLKLERVETRMDFAVIGRRNNMAVVARILLQSLGRGGEMFVIIPQSTLMPMRQQLAHVSASDGEVRDPKWSKQMHSEVSRAAVSLRAVLDERQLTLGDIVDLQIGQVIELEATPRSLVTLECNGFSLFTCHLGQNAGVYTLKVADSIDPSREFINDILPH